MPLWALSRSGFKVRTAWSAVERSVGILNPDCEGQYDEANWNEAPRFAGSRAGK